MEISRQQAHWGEMQLTQTAAQVRFRAAGALPQYGEILRVWGMRADAQPLLIGVAEPDGDHLAIDRTMSKQYLSSLGYWPHLPEQYIADTQPPKGQNFVSQDTYFRQLLRQEEVQIQEQAEYILASCAFSPQKEFAFSGIFSFCRVEDGKAQLIWDKKRDCPVWTVPKETSGFT
ncbi:hypothetical protein [Butyricicoccus sp.]|uniref:hypothetical protein n=1 Tax=Butyricicoccus sp. TaxID=2049021 RepID=UPI003D7E5365